MFWSPWPTFCSDILARIGDGVFGIPPCFSSVPLASPVDSPSVFRRVSLAFPSGLYRVSLAFLLRLIHLAFSCISFALPCFPGVSLAFVSGPYRLGTREARKRAKRAKRAKRWREKARGNGRRHGCNLSMRRSRSNARLNLSVSDSLSLLAGRGVRLHFFRATTSRYLLRASRSHVSTRFFGVLLATFFRRYFWHIFGNVF